MWFAQSFFSSVRTFLPSMRSGKGGKILGIIPICMPRAIRSSLSILSLLAVVDLSSSMYCTRERWRYSNESCSSFTCHHPPTLHNILINKCLIADTAYDFTHPAMSALLAGYRSISAYHIKGLFHLKTCHLACFSILNPFTAAQRQPYSCSTARLPLRNINLAVAQQ